MKKFTYGSRELNKILDDTLMNKYKFPSETLMELAGVAIAQVSNSIMKQNSYKSVCVLVGPGNNGGDGLVAARHLKMMSYNVGLIIFKKLQGKNGIYHDLCLLNEISSKSINQDFELPDQQKAKDNFKQELNKYDFILDGIFGFPFKGQIRSPYNIFIPSLSDYQDKIFSIDIPSGWDADEGNVHKIFEPKYLISLGMPKKCSENFKGQHYFGGRFVPQKVREELKIELPEFYGDQLYTKL